MNVFVFFNQLILYHFPTPKYIWMEIKFRFKKCIGMWDKDEKGKLIENIFIQKIIFFSFFEGFFVFSLIFGRFSYKATRRIGPVKKGSETGPTPVRGDWRLTLNPKSLCYRVLGRLQACSCRLLNCREDQGDFERQSIFPSFPLPLFLSFSTHA